MVLPRRILGFQSAASRTAGTAGSFLISERMLLSIRKPYGSRACKNIAIPNNKRKTQLRHASRSQSGRRKEDRHEQSSIHRVGRDEFTHGGGSPQIFFSSAFLSGFEGLLVS